MLFGPSRTIPRPGDSRRMTTLYVIPHCRDEWGSGGRRFKSSHPDQPPESCQVLPLILPPCPDGVVPLRNTHHACRSPLSCRANTRRWPQEETSEAREGPRTARVTDAHKTALPSFYPWNQWIRELSPVGGPAQEASRHNRGRRSRERFGVGAALAVPLVRGTDVSHAPRASRSVWADCLVASSAPRAAAMRRYFLKSMNLPTPSMTVRGTLESLSR